MKAHGITPDWPAPSNVRAFSTLRRGGFSQGVFSGLNLGLHVNDDPLSVEKNRDLLVKSLNLPNPPLWLNQVHGTRVIQADAANDLNADGSYTRKPEVVCAVMTADCLPILLCDADGSRVAAVHAGWRGLASGVLESAIESFDSAELLAWMGPAIGPNAFEVGIDVLNAFTEKLDGAESAFKPHGEQNWLADLYRLAELTLKQSGVQQIFGGGLCSFSDPENFFSYRRDGQTGRMASLIWLEKP